MPVQDSIPKKILSALETRLETILTDDGFNTDAGLNVYRGRRSFDWADATLFPAVSVFDPVEEADPSHEERIDNILTVFIEGHCWADPDDPADGAHDLLADIKKAVLVYDNQTLGGLAASMEYGGREIEFPDDAGSVVTVRVTVKIAYPELYGDPYTIL